jgi:thiamine biosynthesis protein ThiS
MPHNHLIFARYHPAETQSNERSNHGQVARVGPGGRVEYARSVTILLNGETRDLPGELTVSQLLEHLQVDPRRVAIELNLIVIRRAAYDTAMIREGDRVEIVNFVGGG